MTELACPSPPCCSEAEGAGSGLGCRELVGSLPTRGVQIIGVGVLGCRETRGTGAHLGEVEEMSTQLGEPELWLSSAGNTAQGPASSAPALVHYFPLPLLINRSHSFWLCTHKFEVEFLLGLSVRWRREGGGRSEF